MLTNEQFLEVIKKSFSAYLNIDSSRSTPKLKPLHGNIAEDLHNLFGKDFSIQSQGYGTGKEDKIQGRYYPKNVDITIRYKGEVVAGYAVKFIMRNYSQNSNNYFENMLGETANIRTSSVPYFQIFIAFDKTPYYKKGGELYKYDIITQHHLDKYFVLSKDDTDRFFHVPNKTLIVLLSLKEEDKHCTFLNSKQYADYYKNIINDTDLIKYSTNIPDTFDNSVILNDYAKFIEKTYHIVQGKIK